MELRNKIAKLYDHWIFEEYRLSPEALGLFRILYASILLFIIGVPNFTWISDNPDYIYSPPFSIAMLFSGFPPYYVLQAISTILLVLFVMLLFGYKTKAVSILITVFWVIGNSFAFSFNKIDHGQLMATVLPFIMAFSNWNAAYSIDAKISGKKIEPQYWAVTLMVLILGFAMFTASIPKIMGGWLDLSTHAVKYHFVRNYFLIPRQELLAPFFMEFDNALFWESLDYAGILFEFVFLIALLKVKWMRALVFVAVFFHFMNTLLLNIPFVFNFTVYPLFLSWSLIIALLKEKAWDRKLDKMITFPNMIVSGVVLLVILYVFQAFFGMPFVALPSITRFIVMLVGADQLLTVGLVVIIPAIFISVYCAYHYISQKLVTPKPANV